MTIIGCNLYIFAGGDAQYLNDLHIFNTGSFDLRFRNLVRLLFSSLKVTVRRIVILQSIVGWLSLFIISHNFSLPRFNYHTSTGF